VGAFVGWEGGKARTRRLKLLLGRANNGEGIDTGIDELSVKGSFRGAAEHVAIVGIVASVYL
jgi:hypothetical protein